MSDPIGLPRSLLVLGFYSEEAMVIFLNQGVKSDLYFKRIPLVAMRID